jgi:DHA2 family multidrug resistance protein-like MFS transporter
VIIGMYTLPETPRATHAFDMVSAILSAIAFGALVVFLDALSRPTSLTVLAGELGLAIGTGIVLCRRQMRMTCRCFRSISCASRCSPCRS